MCEYQSTAAKYRRMIIFFYERLQMTDQSDDSRILYDIKSIKCKLLVTYQIKDEVTHT